MNCTSWSVLCQNIYQPEKVECCDFVDKHVATNISLFIKALKECVSLRVCACIQMCFVVTFSDKKDWCIYYLKDYFRIKCLCTFEITICSVSHEELRE